MRLLSTRFTLAYNYMRNGRIKKERKKNRCDKLLLSKNETAPDVKYDRTF